MTNREKLIELLTERDGMVDVIALDEFFAHSPFSISFDGGEIKCGIECKSDNRLCFKCEAEWLNEEAKE